MDRELHVRSDFAAVSLFAQDDGVPAGFVIEITHAGETLGIFQQDVEIPRRRYDDVPAREAADMLSSIIGSLTAIYTVVASRARVQSIRHAMDNDLPLSCLEEGDE